MHEDLAAAGTTIATWNKSAFITLDQLGVRSPAEPDKLVVVVVRSRLVLTNPTKYSTSRP